MAGHTDLELNCAQTWTFSSQNGAAFSGRLSSRGQSPASDLRCVHTGAFFGQLQTDGSSVALRLDPPFRPGGCAGFTGSDMLAGRMIGDDRMTITFTGQAICDSAPGVIGGARHVEIAVAFELTRH